MSALIKARRCAVAEHFDGLGSPVRERCQFGCFPTYDALGRRTKRTLPDGRVERTAYTALGQVQTTGFCNTEETACVELTNTYDHAGRRTALNATVPASLAAHYTGTTSQTWDYDGLNRVLKATDLNGAGTADDIVTRYSYDMLSRVPTQGWGENAGSALWNVTTEFDEAGRKKTLDYPVGAGWNETKLSYEYDALSRLTAVNDLHGANPDETVSAFQYVGSRMIERSDSDGSLWTAAIDSATTRWDKAGRRTGAKVTAGATTFFEESLFYDADDRVTRVEWSKGLPVAGTAAQVYSYDELSRLVNFEQGPWNGCGFSGALSAQHDWTLDEQGNWNKHSDKDSAVGDDWTPPVNDVNAYTSWPTRVDYNGDGTIEANKSLSLSYDAARAFLYEREESQGQYLLYRHDALGRLSTISRRLNGTDTELVRYGYTADGRLAYRSQTTPAEELYLISDGDHVIIERTATATQRTYIWAGATLLKSRATGGVELHLYQDRLGSVVLAMKRESGSTALHGRAQYDPYGNNISNGAWSGNGVGQPYGYTGARWDSVAGLYLMGARWYASEMGRFVELDPIGEGGGWNLYNYVGSSPTMWVDPSGLRPEGAGRFTGFAPAVPGGGFRPIGGVSINGDTRSFLAQYGAGESFGAPGHAIGTGAIPCPMCSEETGDSGTTDEETSDEQESGATDGPGISIEPAPGVGQDRVDEFKSQVESAIGSKLEKGEDGKDHRAGKRRGGTKAANRAFDDASRQDAPFTVGSADDTGAIDRFNTHTVYPENIGKYPKEGSTKDDHAVTQEEITTHIMAEYAEGSRRGFTDEVYKDGAHDLGTQAQNDHREERSRVPLAQNSEETHYQGLWNLLWGNGVDTTFRYMDGSTRNTIIWPGRLLEGGSYMPSSWRGALRWLTRSQLHQIEA